ncbi:MAG: DUF4838 domain-containing protein [Verrucomicrobiales bacterium]|nr:DUF4838 domain-containing protein [Verrucomicrobiales bacterium]MCP5525480.1 DUF4838 domain-containing protein [Verrucomicrobiales bacterium]
MNPFACLPPCTVAALARQSLTALAVVLALLPALPARAAADEIRTERDGSTFDLVADGAPACVIVIADPPSPAARLAALELQSHVLKITGVELPVRSEHAPVTGNRILVGESAATRAFGSRGVDFDPQEYLIGFRPGALILMGRDWKDTPEARREPGRTISDRTLADLRQRIDYWRTVGLPDRGPLEIELPGVFDEQGTCYAAYDFLERCCGVRWYGPTDLTTVIPRRSDLSVPIRDIRRSPALKHRNALSGASWPFLRGQWGEFTPQQVYLHWRRLRLGGEKWAGNHTIHRRTIETVLNDPEYQARGPARGLNLCYSHPKLVQTLAQMARDYFDGKGALPGGFKALGDYFAIVPEDAATYCACERCRALLARGADRGTGFFSGGEISDYWFGFVNAVAREVRRTHPDKFIATLAYWNYAFPPQDGSLEPNVSIAPCLHTCYYPVHPEMRANDRRFYAQWHGLARAPMFLWVYYHHPMEAALIGKWKCFPHVMVHQTADAMRGFIRDGIRGIFECGEQDQVEQYIMARVWDDPETNVDDALKEFFALYFGAAGAPMERFYRRLEAIACDPANYPPPYHRGNGIDWKRAAWETLGTAERIQELGRLIDEAEARAGSDLEQQRVALWRTSIWQWTLDGRREYEASLATSPENH